ncbi:MAG TPA: hypothetical protein DD001_17235, partial [Microcoleaceae bacterium UBA10368]|nr:hypothetical protein [Microcoleaceae cyanobacterium UBA10368]
QENETALGCEGDLNLMGKARKHALAPFFRGARGVKIPLFKGDARGSETRLQARFIMGFSLKLTPMPQAPLLHFAQKLEIICGRCLL